MKKTFLLLTAITLPLLGEVPPVENPDASSPPGLSSSVYATPDAPFRERTEPTNSNTKKAAAVVIGTIAAITIGLLVTGSDTGKHIKPRELRDSSS